jgi:hypothetical protein
MVLSTPVWAAKRAGVEMDDAATVGGQELVLNGLGVREATFLRIDVYVAGLYLPQKSQDPSYILKGDVAKHLEMEFVRGVDKGKQVSAWEDGFKKSAKDYGAIESKVAKVLGWMEDIKDGERMAFTYEPGKGTTFRVKGTTKGTIEGDDFQYALYRIYVGPKPPNTGLREGLLGKS